jgi:DNA repair exonuclease SbcCD nuclease subunit
MAMKLLCCGDLHLRATTPHYRIDSYYETQMKKLDWIFELALKRDCSAILQPGDFFDSPNIPNHVLSDVLELLYSEKIPVITVFGQHDLKYRNISNTALDVIQIANGVTIATDKPIGSGVDIYGASWEAPIPKILNKEAINILVIHRMIINDKPLWPGQTDYIRARSMLLKYKDFNLVVSGDNHQSFVWQENNGRGLINCGSMMRMSTDQQNHKPCVWIYDTVNMKARQYFIPIERDVFSPEADEAKERNKELEAFIQSLAKDNKERQLSFEENVEMLKATTKFSKEVRTLVATFLEGYYGSR